MFGLGVKLSPQRSFLFAVNALCKEENDRKHHKVKVKVVLLAQYTGDNGKLSFIKSIYLTLMLYCIKISQPLFFYSNCLPNLYHIVKIFFHTSVYFTLTEQFS